MQGGVVVLNGAPRSGKTSIARSLADADPSRRWRNIGVDSVVAATPADQLPGIGLRPGGERPDLEAVVVEGFRSLYADVAERARAGGWVVVDVGHHSGYSRPLGTHRIAAAALDGLPVLVVGVHCALDEILRRRAASGASYLAAGEGEPVPEPVQRWQTAVHTPGVYDLEVDTSQITADAAAGAVLDRLAGGPQGTAITAWSSI